MYSQLKVKLTLTSVSPLMNTLNTDACDIEIGKEEKKTLRYREGNRVRTRHCPFHCQNYTSQTGADNLKVHTGIEIRTQRELPPVSFSFSHSFLDLGMGMKYDLGFEISVSSLQQSANLPTQISATKSVQSHKRTIVTSYEDSFNNRLE